MRVGVWSLTTKYIGVKLLVNQNKERTFKTKKLSKHDLKFNTLLITGSMSTNSMSTVYYIDDAKIVQGPFSTRKIRKWFNRGLLPGSLLLTNTPQDDDSWRALLDFDELTKPTAKPQKLARPTKQAVETDTTRVIRAQILTAQFELALIQLQHDALRTVAENLSEANQHFFPLDLKANIQLLSATARLNRGSNAVPLINTNR
jgi:hypothetical protein